MNVTFSHSLLFQLYLAQALRLEKSGAGFQRTMRASRRSGEADLKSGPSRYLTLTVYMGE